MERKTKKPIIEIIKKKNDVYTATGDELDPLVLYLKQISQYKLLTGADEIEIGRNIKTLTKEIEQLIERNAMHPMPPDEFNRKLVELKEWLANNKSRMVNANLRLVVSVAKSYQYRGLYLLDLIAEGNIGLIEAVDRFDYTLGYRFSTYGTWWIRQAITKSLADKSRVIRIPVHMLNTIKKCFLMSKQLTQDIGHAPTPEELAVALDMPPQKVKDILSISQDTISLDSSIDDENMTRLANLVRDEKSIEPVESVMTEMLQDTIHDVLSNFPERERKIIEMRFGLNDLPPMTLEETGRVIGITRERVRQIQEKIMHKMRKNQKLKEFI